ncbi:MAG: DMT family transporter [Elusimicrobia bacterium]|nr:DMT family transporter [Elusimicrobiota bacterium]
MRARPLILLIACNALGGFSYCASAWAMRGFAPVPLVFWRTLVAVVLFAPWTVRALRSGGISAGDWMRVAAVAVFGYAAPLLMGTIGQSASSATNAVLLNAVEPLSLVLMSAAFLGERLGARRIASIAAGFIGAAAIVSQGFSSQTAASPSVRGDMLLALGGFCWALHSVIGKDLLRRIGAMELSAVTITLSLLPIAAAAFAARGAAAPEAGPASWLWMAFLGVAVTFLSTALWNLGLQEVDASALANIIFLQPLVGVLAGVVFLHDRVTAWTGVGGALILAGVFAASRDMRAEPAHPASDAAPPAAAETAFPV